MQNTEDPKNGGRIDVSGLATWGGIRGEVESHLERDSMGTREPFGDALRRHYRINREPF